MALEITVGPSQLALYQGQSVLITGTLRHPKVLQRPINDAGVLSFDLTADKRE